MTEREQTHGAYTANERDWGVDGGAPSIDADGFVIGLCYYDLSVGWFSDDFDGAVGRYGNTSIAAWTRPEVLAAVEAAAATAGATDLTGLADALDAVARWFGWWS